MAQRKLDDDAALLDPATPTPTVVEWLGRGWTTPSFPVRVAKRAIDVALSLACLLLVLPFLTLTIIAIMLESRGAPIYVQRRVGRYGAAFGLIKLRTMVPDAEERLHAFLLADPALEAEWQRSRKLRADPRVTRIGGLLRRWSLDEVPQLINVLLGQMSLVGPRPVPAQEGAMFGVTWPLVLSVRPGLTGLWAVSGRSELSYEERVALEATYVRECSLGLDLRIIGRTVPWVLRGRGSY